MRRQHSIPIALGLALLLAARQDCFAQLPAYEPPQEAIDVSTAARQNFYNYPPPVYSTPTPGSYDPVELYGGAPVTHHPPAVYPPGSADYMPHHMQPWPTISPYDHHFSQHINHDGLWFHDFNSRGPRYTFGIDYINATMNGGSRTVVGQKGANTYQEYMLRLSRLSSDDAIEEDRIGELFDRFNAATELNFPIDGPNQIFNYFDPVVSADVLPEVDADGVRIQWGVIDPDESGFIVTGWWGRGAEGWDANDHVTRPSGDLNVIFDIFDVFQFQAELPPEDPLNIASGGVYANLRGLPLDDGSGPFGGVTVPFDLEFQVEWKTSVYELTGEFMLTPIFKRKAVMVRPMWGMRYMHLHETFGFFGRDSGVIYGIETDPTTPELKTHSVPNGVDDNLDSIIDNSIVPEEDGGTGIIFFPDPFDAFLDSNTRSHMVGPEVGVRYDLGGDKFKFYGQSKFALLANFERVKIKGDNIGHKLRAERLPGLGVQPWIPFDDGDLRTPTPGDLTPNAFETDEDHSHVSPLLEQSFFVEAPLFAHIPLFKKINFLESAIVRGGYTYIGVYEVLKPDESIIWQGNPEAGLFPTISPERDKWWTSNWSLGIHWNY